MPALGDHKGAPLPGHCLIDHVYRIAQTVFLTNFGSQGGGILLDSLIGYRLLDGVGEFNGRQLMPRNRFRPHTQGDGRLDVAACAAGDDNDLGHGGDFSRETAVLTHQHGIKNMINYAHE